MKKKIIGLMLFTASVVPVWSGHAKSQPGKHKNPCEKLQHAHRFMKDSLALSADQDKKIGIINDSACAKIARLKVTKQGNPEAMKSGMKEIMRDSRIAVKEVLTPEQQQKLQQHFRKKQNKNHNPEKVAEEMTRRMTIKLELNAAQQVSVNAANLEFLQQLQSLKQQKKEGADSASVKSGMKTAHQNHNARLRQILSPEQFQKYSEMKKERMEKHQKARK